MLVKSCRAYHFRTLIADNNPELDNRNPSRATDLGNACERKQTARAQLVECQKHMENEKAPSLFD